MQTWFFVVDDVAVELKRRHSNRVITDRLSPHHSRVSFGDVGASWRCHLFGRRIYIAMCVVPTSSVVECGAWANGHRTARMHYMTPADERRDLGAHTQRPVRFNSASHLQPLASWVRPGACGRVLTTRLVAITVGLAPSSSTSWRRTSP